jgi:NTE family protein
MPKQKIAIACQGGGSQTAFTAGVLTQLLRAEVHTKHELVSLSGTSGGAICAALAWYGLLAAHGGDATPVEQRLHEFWRDNATQSLVEQYLNHALIQYIQLENGGLLPHLASSPYGYTHQLMTTTFEWLLPGFYDFKGILEKHIDFKRLPDLIAASKNPVLIIGAADVLSGDFKKFNSHQDGIQIEMLLASAAVPSLTKAVKVEDRAYWDGLFSDNPPTNELVDHHLVGENRIPDQIWVIQINPKERSRIPRTPAEITDRRNEMIGNQSLYHDLAHICFVNKLIRRGAFEGKYQLDYHLKPVEIYIIQMSPHLQEKLDYASKLDRSSAFIELLMADGEGQAQAFLKDPKAMQYEDETR